MFEPCLRASREDAALGNKSVQSRARPVQASQDASASVAILVPAVLRHAR